MSYGFSIRSKLGLTIPSGGNGFNTLSEHQQLQCVPDSFNNNYKKSIFIYLLFQTESPPPWEYKIPEGDLNVTGDIELYFPALLGNFFAKIWL